LTCLQFRYDGDKRSGRRPERCFFPPRYPLQNPCYSCKPIGNQEYQSQGQLRQNNPQQNKTMEQCIKQVPDVSSPKEEAQQTEEVAKEEFQQTEEVKEDEAPDYAKISEILINKLSITEADLSEARNTVELYKPVIDDLMYKLESFIQILDIIKANERRRLSGTQAETASFKISKDSVDEILELLEGPVFQNVLRQFLVGVLVKK